MNVGDFLCNVLYVTDLIDRADGLRAGLANIQHGGTLEIQVERTGPMSGADCERLLKKYRIPIAGRLVSAKHFHFQIRRQQAKWTEYILLRAGAPVARLIEPRNGQWAAGHDGPPPAWGETPPGRRCACWRIWPAWLRSLVYRMARFFSA